MRLLPLVLVIVGGLLAWFADAAARRRHAARDSGHLWAVATAVIGTLGVLDAVSASLETFPRAWVPGWHLERDRALGTRQAYYTALAMPFLIWASALLICAARTPPHDHAMRWLAGSIGKPGVRGWVLNAAALPAIVVVFGYSRLDQGSLGMSGATWLISALLILSLVFLALSAGPVPAAPLAAPVGLPLEAPAALGPWPEGMRERGIALERLVEWPASAPPRRVLLPQAIPTLQRLESAGAAGVAPELVEVVTRLITETELPSRSGLVFAPDDCGQAEVVADAASELMLNGNESTLVISPSEDDELFRRLSSWLPGRRKDDVQRLRPGADVPAEGATIWLVDVQTLSDQFLERLTEARVASRVGLIVWWDVHRYSGVLAANVWAISRRVHRLMSVVGRPGLRTLVLVREASHAAAQLKPFIQRLLPYDYSSDMIRHVEQGFARSVSVYHLRGHAERYRRRHDTLPEKCRHAVLVAAEASTELRWRTHLLRPPDVAQDERDIVAAQSLDADTLVAAQLVDAGAEAGARILHLADADALALSEVVSQGGRALPRERPHHVALTTSDNPFVPYLLRQIGEHSLASVGSRRLVGAKGHSRIIEHHLLAALRELPDTRSGLRQTFLWNDQVIEATLEALHKAGSLDREEVRYLDQDGTRVIDYRYRSRHPHGPAAHPLDTVGVDLVEVRDDTAGHDDKGVRMRVDRERVTIQAYPYRVFERRGARYRIHEWTDEEKRAGKLRCEFDERHARTWRVRQTQVSRITTKPGRTPTVVARRGDYSLTRTIVDLVYEESVYGVIRMEMDPATGELSATAPPHVVARKSDPFSTTALVLAFDHRSAAGTSKVAEGTLATLSVALACVLPVMLGVDHDALEVVQLRGRHMARAASDGSSGAAPTIVHGLAIVDLYPNGIGLVDAFEDDPAFLPHVLDLTRRWLRDDATAAALAKSPLAQAVRVEPDVTRAVGLLDLLLGTAAPTGLAAREGRG